MARSPTFEDALADLAWLRRFAGSLAADTDTADDLVQETLLAAWTRPARDASDSSRPWLAAVVRNRWRMLQRATHRRDAREQAASWTDTAASPIDDAVRIEVLEALLSALRALPPDDRSILVARFFEDRSANEIGAALGMPAATVRSRIHRSIKRLRDDLDHRFGTRQHWGLALAFPTFVPTTPRGTMMSLAGKITLFVGVAAGASAGAAAWAWQHDPPPSPADTTPPTPAPEAVPTVIRGVGNESGASLGRRTWAARRTAIRGALPPVDQTPPTVESSDPQAQPGWIDVGSFARACVEDLAPETNAALTVDVTVVGSPETGVIVDSVDLIETTIRDPAVLECIAESIYTHVGKPPAKPFSKTTRASLAVGDSHESDAKQQRMFEAIVGAHIGEVHYCQNEKATGPVQGTLPVRFTIVPNAEFGSAGRVERTDAGETTIEAAVVDCTLAAARRWMFPVALAGKTVTYTYTFPIPAGRIVVPSARE